MSKITLQKNIQEATADNQTVTIHINFFFSHRCFFKLFAVFGSFNQITIVPAAANILCFKGKRKNILI